MIPKVIYICHKELNEIEIHSLNWKKLNPEYEIKLYDDFLCEKFLLEEYSQLHYDIFKYIRHGPIKSDFWRVCILYKYGGIYVDADIEPLVSLNDYIEENIDFVSCISGTKVGKLNPHYIMANAAEPILKYCIDKYIDLFEEKIYSYWKWSIVKIISRYPLFQNNNFTKSGIYVFNNKKYQLLKETNDDRLIVDIYNYYCEYKNRKVLNNRYLFYDFKNHKFA